MDFPCGSAGKESACNAGDLSLIPGLGRSPGEGKGYPLQYSGQENSMGSSWGHQESNTTERLSYDSKVRTCEKLRVRVFLLLCVQVPFFPHSDVNVYFLSFPLYTKVATLSHIFFFCILLFILGMFFHGMGVSSCLICPLLIGIVFSFCCCWKCCREY